MNDGVTSRDIDALRELLFSEVRRLDALRHSDIAAVRLAHTDLSKRLEGFPQQFATKKEVEAAKEIVQRLEKEAVNREIYETNIKGLETSLNGVDREKLPSSTFQTFVDNYHRERDEASIERRSVAIALAAGAAKESGQTATWRQIGGVIAAVATLFGLVALIINYFAGGG
jgi:hypothetical protein